MDWEQRVTALWGSIEDYRDEEFLAAMDELVAELPPESAAIAAYERGSAFDSTGHSDQAVPLYREALELGLGEDRRRQAVIQLASSLRNMGEATEAVALLEEEQAAASDDLDDAVSAFLALALADTGAEREALSIALAALARHMVRYKRSLENYASELSP